MTRVDFDNRFWIQGVNLIPIISIPAEMTISSEMRVPENGAFPLTIESRKITGTDTVKERLKAHQATKLTVVFKVR